MTTTPGEQLKEWRKSAASPAYFVHTYGRLLDPGSEEWKPFHLWPAQVRVLAAMRDEKLVAVLKARQLGLSWLALGYALWLATFQANAIILMFSKSDTEAKELVTRYQGMHERLPPFLQREVERSNDHVLEFTTGSRAQAFASGGTGGRSYTASLVIVDEADFAPRLKNLLTAVKPTIDAAGQLFLISTADKDKPNSTFKRVWRAGEAGRNGYHAIFLPWSSRPGRDEAWYARQKAEAASIDDLYQEYPAEPAEAMSTRSESKRFQWAWFANVFEPAEPVADERTPTIPGLTCYLLPQAGAEYVVAVDTSEGDPTSDPSPATVFQKDTWEEVAHLYGIFEPSILADYVRQLGEYYNTAVVCVERNNHGHAVILALDVAGYESIYINPFDKKKGWLSNSKYKPLAVNKTADALRDESLILHTEATKLELANLEAATLAAPEGDHDDRALTIVIGVAALAWPTAQTDPYGAMYIERIR